MKRAFAFGDKSIDAAVRRVNDVRRVAIIGAGTMGRGIIADLLSKTDYQITLLDVERDALDSARAHFADVREKRLRAQDAEVLDGRIAYTQSYDDLTDADVIWEAATERVEIKKRIFQAI